MKALVVDDCAVSTATISKLLKNYGTVETTDSGQAGLDLLSEAAKSDAPFDVLCVDINMPGMDGFELLKRLKGMPRETAQSDKTMKVFMTTGQNEIRLVLRAMEHGCSGYLVKPISEDNLATEMAKIGVPALVIPVTKTFRS